MSARFTRGTVLEVTMTTEQGAKTFKFVSDRDESNIEGLIVDFIQNCDPVSDDGCWCGCDCDCVEMRKIWDDETSRWVMPPLVMVTEKVLS